MKRGDLNDLSAFSAVAGARSFTRAAAEIGLSPSALSHAIRGLEERLGIVLLARTTRSVAPTPAGAQLLRALDPALAGIAEGLAALDDWRDVPSGSIRLTTLSYAARTILADRLPTFLLDHPEVTVEVIVDDRPVDIVADGFDAGIRMGGTVEADMVAVRLEPNRRVLVVGAPAYFARHPKPETPRDLEGHVCINYRLVGRGGLRPWAFERDGAKVVVRPRGRLIVNDGMLAAAAVRAGAGLGALIEHEIADDLAAGRLIRVLDDWCPVVPGCHLYYPDRRVSAPLAALARALRGTGP